MMDQRERAHVQDILARYWRGFQLELFDPDPRSNCLGDRMPRILAIVFDDFGLFRPAGAAGVIGR